MSELYRGLKPNPIIEAAKTKGDGRIQKLTGYIGEGAPGKIELYLDLQMETCFELDEKDVIYAVEAEKPTEPALIFVREKAHLVIRHKITAVAAAASTASGCGCGGACGSGGSEESHQTVALQRRNGGSTGSADLDCAIAKAGCSIRCWLNHSNDPLMEQACNDSCNAAYRLCRRSSAYGGNILGTFFI